MDYEKLTEEIIGSSYRVYKKMGFGFLLNAYDKCRLIELEKAGLNAESQKPIAVHFGNEIVGEFIADMNC